MIVAAAVLAQLAVKHRRGEAQRALMSFMCGAAVAFALHRYVDISDSIYPDRYPVLIKQQQVIKVRQQQLGSSKLQLRGGK